MNDVQIQFQGFHPSPFTEQFLDAKIYEILNQAPPGSVLRAVFRRKDKVLTASVRILSGGDSFFATARGTHLREVGHQLIARMRRQLRRLKTIRHRTLRQRLLYNGGHHDTDVA
jgi:hypothetical protein